MGTSNELGFVLLPRYRCFNHRCHLVCHFLQDYQVMWTKTKIWLEVQRKKSRIFDLRWWKRIFHCHEINKIFEFYNFLVETLTKVKPDAGLEPATVGLKVQRSTDWANQARLVRHHTQFLTWVNRSKAPLKKFCWSFGPKNMTLRNI